MQSVVLQRVVGAARFDRESFLWMLWNDRAGGDAALLVLGTDAVIAIGLFGLDIELLLRWVIGGIFFWLIYSGVAYAAAKFLFEGSGQFAGVLRIAGFAYPTRLLVLALSTLFGVTPWMFLLGSAWFLAIVAHGMKEAMELPIEKGALAALAGLAGFLIFSAIFRF